MEFISEDDLESFSDEEAPEQSSLKHEAQKKLIQQPSVLENISLTSGIIFPC